MSTIDSRTSRHRTGSGAWSRAWTHLHIERHIAGLAVHITSNTALSGATANIDRGQHRVG